MTTATRIALRRLRARHGIAAVIGALLVVVCGVAAFAYWTTTGAGAGTATAANLATPTGVTVSTSGSTVTVNWTGVTPPAGTLNGYYVTRYLGATPSNACGTNPTTPTLIAAGTLTCNDTGVANGTYTYTVTAVFHSWTGTSPASGSVVVNADPTPPTQVVALASGAGTAYLGGMTIYYRGDLAGTFTLSDAVSDSGSGPASANFPALASNGWTHTLASPTTGTGSAPTITYAGGTYGWSVGATSPGTHTITGKDVAGNAVTTNLTFASDVAGPTGGALVVNGVTGTSGGATAYSTGTITGTRTDYSADTGSGFASSTLRLDVGTLTNGVCSAYGPATVVTGAPNLTGQPAGCYRYTLTGLDRVGNASVLTTIVQVDSTAPTQTLSETGANSYLSGANLYFKSDVAGTMTLGDSVTDTGSGPKQVDYPAIAANGWTHTADTVTPGTGANPTFTYPSSTYTWTAGATSPSTTLTTVTARDQSNNQNTSTLTFVPDVTGPTGGGLTLNSTAAAGVATTSVSATGTFTGTRTDYSADLGSGYSSTTLTREVGTLSGGACSAYAPPTTVVGVPNEIALATGCYRYTLTGKDNVGNTSSVVTVVQVDRAAPTQVVSESGTRSYLNGTTLYYNGGTGGSLTLTDAVTDSGVGPKQATFPAFSTTGWGHTSSETVTGASPYTSSAITWTAGAGVPPSYPVTGYDQAGNSVTTSLDLVDDEDAPVGGALMANGTDATAAGSTSTSSTGSFSGTYTPFTDADSGIATETIVRTTAPLSNGVCGTFASPVTVTWTSETGLATNCYMYTVTSTDNVGNVASISTTVEVDRDAPTQALSETGANTFLSGNTLFYNNTVNGSFTLSDDVTDAGLGPASVTYPTLTATGWTTHASETVAPGTGALPTLTFPSSSFSWTAGSTAPAAYVVTAKDQVANPSTSSLNITPDITQPTGGSLVVNGVTATASGAYSAASTAGWTGTRVDFNADTGSGFAAGSSVLTREFAPTVGGTCPTYQAPTTLTGGTITQGTATAGCYRYTLTAKDNVGNTSVRTVVVTTFADTTAPTQVYSANNNGWVVGTTMFYRNTVAGSAVVTSTVNDLQSGPKQVTFPALTSTGWTTHAADVQTVGVGTTPTIAYSSSYSWNAGAAAPAATAIVARDNANIASTTPAMGFTVDNSAPTGGSLVVNGTTATAGGAASTTVTGTFTGTRTDWSADVGSGVASSVLTRQYVAFSSGTTCGTTYGAATTITGVPNETSLPTGCYKYTLTGTDHVGNATSVSTIVSVIPGSLTQVVTLNGGAGKAVLSGTTLYYNPAVAGSFTLTDTVTGVGSAPNGATFPALTTTGWTGHTTAQNLTGAGPYTSNTYNWATTAALPGVYTVTGKNALGNTVDTALTFDQDTTGPTGGDLTVNGVSGTTAGAAGGSSNSFPVAFTPYSTDAESGYASTTLVRTVATLSSGSVCGTTYATPVTVTAGTQAPAATGCYKYTLTGTDAVGNTSSIAVIVKVDLTAPTLTLTDDANNGHLVGTTMYYRTSGGSFVLTGAVNDAGVGPGSVNYPALSATGWTTHANETPSSTGPAPLASYPSSAFTWGSGASAPGPYTITGSDLLGNSVTSTLSTWTSDGAGPTGGALTVNGTAATAAGTQSNFTYTATTPNVTMTRTNYTTDALSGLRSSDLRVQTAPWDGTTCGTYGALSGPIAVGTTSVPVVGGYCNRFVLTGTDNVGNVSTLSTVVTSTLNIASVVLANGPNTAGTINRGDTITIKYNGPIDVSTLCSTWTDSFADQTIDDDNVAAVTLYGPTSTTTNDYMYVTTSSAACGGNFRFGTLRLGDPGYLVSTSVQSFYGTGGGVNVSTIAYDASAYTLTVTLGYNQTTPPGIDGSNAVTANTIAVYSPSIDANGVALPGGPVKGVGGLSLTGTGSTANARQF